MAEQSIFISLLDRMKRGSTSRPLANEKTVINGNQVTPNSNPIQQKQQQFLDVQSNKIAQDIYSRSVYYDTDRLGAYADFRAMDMSPEVSAALDIITDECVTRNERGDILSIYSENQRIKTVLKDLFKNRLNIEYNLTFWIREMVKFGDTFIKLELDQKEGIYDVRMLPVSEMHREEAFDGNVNTSRFKWDINNMYFEEFQMAHFRLISDGTKIPYGRSVLDSARKLWKQLQLAEDAMLVYRIVRAPERRVHYIEVGNLEPGDVQQYIEKIKRELKKAPIVDQKTGQVNLKYNPMTLEEDYFLPIRGDKSSRIESLPGACLALDTKIELLDGRSLELNEIIEEYKQGKDLWSYSINPETGEIVPGQITWAGVTRKDAEVLKITLDNGETITTTIDHKFPTKFNGIKEAKDLEVGESLWSFNKKFEKIFKLKPRAKEYEMIFNHETKKWEYTHRMVANYFKKLKCENTHVFDIKNDDKPKRTIHHFNFKHTDNNPSNLYFMNFHDHTMLHQSMSHEYKEERNKGIKDYWDNISEEEKSRKGEISKKNIAKATAKLQELLLTDEEFKKEFYLKTGKGIKKVKNTPEAKAAQGALARGYWKNEEYRKAIKDKQAIKYSNNMLKYVADKFREGLTANSILECINKENSEFIIEFNSLNKGNEQLKKMVNGFTHNNLYKMVKYFGYENWRDFKNKFEFFNHKIVSIEFLNEKQDTGTITIDGSEKYHKLHNFALSVGVFTQNSNLSEISDVEYLQNKLFSALKVPKPYLNYAESMPGGSTLSQADLRFSRTINRIQENVIIELRRIANIHLFLLGFEDDMDNFDLKLTNPSTQQELLKLETMKARLEVFKEIFTNEATSPVSYTWAMEYIMGFSKAEIKQILRQKKVEKKMFSEIDSAPEEYNATGLFKEIDDKFQKTTGNLGQADASGAGGEEMSAASGGETTDMDAGGSSFGGESAFGGGNELPTSEPEATTEEPSAEPLAENLLFENDKNNDLIESLFENQNKKLNTKTQRLVDSITERLNKINEETNSDEENDSLNSGNFDSNVL